MATPRKKIMSKAEAVVRIELSESERQEVTQLLGRLMQRRVLLTEQIIASATEIRLLDDNLTMRIRELAAAHKVPDGWQWDSTGLCFRTK